MPKSAVKKTRTLHLADGGEVLIPEGLDNVVGIDEEGRVVCDPFDAFHAKPDQQAHVFGLTLCCYAYDKGYEDGVYCRGCAGDDAGMYHFRYRDGTWPAEIRWAAGVAFLTKLAQPVVVPESHPIGGTPVPAATPKRSKTVSKTATTQPATKRGGKSAAEQFKAMGIPESDWTDTMQVAVKQRWSSLPVDEKVADLRARLAAVAEPVLPSLEDLTKQYEAAADPHAEQTATDELARLKRNAKVQTWRARKQIQAALDARDLKFKALRSAGTKAASKAKKSATGDAAPTTAVA